MRRTQQRDAPVRRVDDAEPPHEIGPGAREAEGERPAPVVPDDVDPAAHLLVDERAELPHQGGDVVGPVVGRAAESGEVGGEHAPPGRREGGGDVAPQRRGLGDAVQQQHRDAVAVCALLAEEEAGVRGDHGADAGAAHE